MNFIEYLQEKKIDADQFRQWESARFEEWTQLFGEMHPDSFTMQKKFYLNDLRRKYPLK